MPSGHQERLYLAGPGSSCFPGPEWLPAQLQVAQEGLFGEPLSVLGYMKSMRSLSSMSCLTFMSSLIFLSSMKPRSAALR